MSTVTHSREYNVKFNFTNGSLLQQSDRDVR